MQVKNPLLVFVCKMCLFKPFSLLICKFVYKVQSSSTGLASSTLLYSLESKSSKLFGKHWDK